MAHFAEIDENNIVTRVIVVPDEQENRGQEYLASDLGLGGTWVQTSYNANIRRKFAGIGDFYNVEKDRFEPPKPFDSWIWSEELYAWQAPEPHPENGNYYEWDETAVQWVEIDPRTGLRVISA